jgi:hypothetical protein
MFCKIIRCTTIIKLLISIKYWKKIFAVKIKKYFFFLYDIMMYVVNDSNLSIIIIKFKKSGKHTWKLLSSSLHKAIEIENIIYKMCEINLNCLIKG